MIPNLRRFPRIGRPYLDTPPKSAEALAQLAAMPAGAPDALRICLHGDYVMLYTAVEASATVFYSPSATIDSFRLISLDCGAMGRGKCALRLLVSCFRTLILSISFYPSQWKMEATIANNYLFIYPLEVNSYGLILVVSHAYLQVAKHIYIFIVVSEFSLFFQ